MTLSLNKHDLAILRFLYKINKPVYQSDIPKITNLDLKVATKSLYKLEKLGLLLREPATHNKRRTYLVRLNKGKLAKLLEEYGEFILNSRELFAQIADLPCISCQHIFKCYEGGFHDPIYCPLLNNYTRTCNESKSA